MNYFILIACCVLSLCVCSLGLKGFVSLERYRPSTTSRLHMSSSQSLLGERLDSVTNQLNFVSGNNVNSDIFSSDPSYMGIQDLLQQAMFNHELAVTCTVSIMVGLGFMIFKQLAESDGKIGIGEYWFTFLLLGDLAYSIKG